MCFKIKKRLLIEQSDVFSIMLQSGMKEGHTSVINMTDINPKALIDFIRYVYLGYLDEDGAKSAEELLIFADKYLITKLKEECISILKKGINKHNILYRLEVAFMCNIEELKDHLLKYSTDSFFKDGWEWVMKTNEWVDFVSTNTEVACDIKRALGAKLSQFEYLSN